MPSDKPVLLIFCGSSGSQRVNAAVHKQLPLLLERFTVLHVRGNGNLDPSLHDVPGYWQVEYLHSDMVNALWLADLVVGRAGATTLAELEALDKRAVLIPLPASVSRGDQLDNAAAYERRRPDRCVIVPDNDDPGDGRQLAEACLKLEAGPTERGQHPTPQRIFEAADLVAQEVISTARIRGR